jgi:hypothetical protein
MGKDQFSDLGEMKPSTRNEATAINFHHCCKSFAPAINTMRMILTGNKMAGYY